jgi:hypothetical protein
MIRIKDYIEALEHLMQLVSIPIALLAYSIPTYILVHCAPIQTLKLQSLHELAFLYVAYRLLALHQGSFHMMQLPTMALYVPFGDDSLIRYQFSP